MKAAWILGNGPSLMETPLDLLKDEDTFAVNNIQRIFEYTSWRPKFYVRTDDAVDAQFNTDRNKVVTEIDGVMKEGVMCYLGSYFYNIMWKNGYYLGMMKIMPADMCHGQRLHAQDHESCKGWHFYPDGRMKQLCSFGGSVSVAIQIASIRQRKPYEYDEIYLVGCDLGFTKDGSDHFVNDYYDHENDPVPAEVREMDTVAAHKIAKTWSRIPIYNATIGGNLEVYERVDFFDVLRR